MPRRDAAPSELQIQRGAQVIDERGQALQVFFHHLP
jgi:hypothetical protein